MDVIVNFTIDDRAARRMLDDTQYRQVPFATSLALNETMKLAQEDVRREYERRFTMRNTSLAKALTTIPRGSFATKRKLRVEMMNVRDRRTGRMAGEGFVNRQMKGGGKVARGRGIAIPILGKGMRRLKGGSLPKGKKAKNRDDLFKMGKNGRILYQRVHKKPVARFVLTKTAKPSSRGRFKYIPTGKTSIQRNIRQQWKMAMIRAARTARP